MGQAVNLAVGRFVTVGEAIASENQELKEEMNVACTEAKRAGQWASEEDRRERELGLGAHDH